MKLETSINTFLIICSTYKNQKTHFLFFDWLLIIGSAHIIWLQISFPWVLTRTQRTPKKMKFCIHKLLSHLNSCCKFHYLLNHQRNIKPLESYIEKSIFQKSIYFYGFLCKMFVGNLRIFMFLYFARRWALKR